MGNDESSEIKQNNLIFILNVDCKIAGIVGNDNASGDIFIPRSIKYKTTEYTIKRILKYSFKNSKSIRSITFPADSSIDTIEKESFSNSTLESISIPSSLLVLKECWCKFTPNLTKVTIMPNNPNFMYIDNKMIIGKEDKKSDIYDVLVFVRRDADDVQIPSFINRIASYAFSETIIQKVSIPSHITYICEGAFYRCEQLREVIFEPGSQLNTIETLAFSETSIECLSIPATITELREGWCANNPKLKGVKLQKKPNPETSNTNSSSEKVVENNSNENEVSSTDKIVTNSDENEISSTERTAENNSDENDVSLNERAAENNSNENDVSLNERAAENNSNENDVSVIENVISNSDANGVSLNGKTTENNSDANDVSVPDKVISNSDEKQLATSSSISSTNLLDNLLCPICYLVMLPPNRTPMIIPGCGHTICEACISKLDECPFCHQKFVKATRNMLAVQLIESIKDDLQISPELNPPPPHENKLIPRIDPICTYIATGETYIKQKRYQCRTCQISGDKGFCEICAKTCHAGHDVYYVPEVELSFCDCPMLCNCKRLPEIDEFRCTYEITYGVPIEQPMYQCKDCHIVGNLYLCQNCAIKCHFGHNLKYVGILKNKICHCFDQCVCKISSKSRKPFCTYVKTGPNYIKQNEYACYTCNLVGSKGCCSACANYCHRNHATEFSYLADRFYCDCVENCKCCLLHEDENSPCEYLRRCPNFRFKDNDKKIEQRKYHCFTCSILGPLGICEACAVNCHINHSIEYVGIENFCCTCQSTDDCTMMMNPLLHDDRTCCDRRVLGKDDVSACYTCYTCDNSGKINICETCALKKHLRHDIHLVGYMKFDCHG